MGVVEAGGDRRPAAELDETRRRPARAISLLLISQAVGLAGIVLYGVLRIDWRQILQPDSLSQGSGTEVGRAVAVLLLFAPPAALSVFGALGCLFSSRWGWLLAALAQGWSLGACLFLYSEWAPPFVYPVMLYCVVMVLYLNSRHVRETFHSGRGPAPRGAGGP